MAGSAIVYDAGMVESGWSEALRIVTNAAILIGCNVIVVFARGEPSAMTG